MRLTLRKTAIGLLILLTATACNPAQRLAWDRAHGLPDGTTHRAICESNPNDQYCQPQTSSHRIERTPERIIEEVFAGQVATAKRVAWCESKFDTAPRRNPSPTNDWGLFQINATTWNKPNHPDPVAQFIGAHWHNVTDPWTNALMAKKIVDRYGWRMWSCY